MKVSKKTKRKRCLECGHLEGYKKDIASEQEWLCKCECHNKLIVEHKKEKK